VLTHLLRLSYRTGSVGCGTRLSAKAFQHLRVFCNVPRQELQSDEATDFGVLSLVNHSHATAAELLDDAVARDGLADHEQGCYGGRVGKSMKAVEMGEP
jgi:hypothetical protein